MQTVGTEHYLVCDGPEDCIFAARAMNGIEVAGAPARVHQHDCRASSRNNFGERRFVPQSADVVDDGCAGRERGIGR